MVRQPSVNLQQKTDPEKNAEDNNIKAVAEMEDDKAIVPYTSKED